MPMSTKTDRLVKYLKGIPPLNSHDPLIRTFFKIV